MTERPQKKLYDEVSRHEGQPYKKGDWRKYPEIVHDDHNIKGFFGEYRWLSNFGDATIQLDGATYTSVETAYQAAKRSPYDRLYLQNCNPREAIKYNRKHPSRFYTEATWEALKETVMRFLLEQKFDPLTNPDNAQRLLETGDKYLEETNWWGDTYWGRTLDSEGQNMLGSIIMDIRSRYQVRDGIIQKRGYDETLRGDELSLEISSYPVSAKYLAERLAPHGTTIAEFCCGVGVSIREFTEHFEMVIGVDNDTRVIEHARENLQDIDASKYQLLRADVTDPRLYDAMRTDIVAYDIPYWSEHSDEKSKLTNPDLLAIINAIEVKITPNIVVYTPPNFDFSTLDAYTGAVSVDEIWIDGRHDRNFIYFGDLVTDGPLQKVELHTEI